MNVAFNVQMLSGLFVLIGLGLILPLGRYATKAGEKPSLWLSPLVLMWGFLWVLLSNINWTFFVDGYTFWLKWGIFLGVGLVIYLAFWWKLKQKAKENVARKIDEIGQNVN